MVSVDNLEHVEDDVEAMRTLLHALRPGGRLVVHVPGYERRWILFGRRVNFDVPGHVRPGYKAEELVEQAPARPASRSSTHQYTYGVLETFTNNISYLITGADQRRKMAVRRGIPGLAGRLLPREVLPAAVGRRRPCGGAASGCAARQRRRRRQQKVPDRMRVLIDILHPAHVHFFRNFYAEMEGRGHEVCITARDKDRSVELLRAFDLPYQQISRQRSGGVGLAVEMAQRTPRLMKIMRSFQPDVMTGIMGPSIALAGALRRVPAVVFYDTEFAVQTNRLVYPLAYSVCTPDCYQGKVPGRHLQYAGYHELAYLHPNRFQPDPAVLAAFGVSPDEPYSIVRFVSWQAVHDRQRARPVGQAEAAPG